MSQLHIDAPARESSASLVEDILALDDRRAEFVFNHVARELFSGATVELDEVVAGFPNELDADLATELRSIGSDQGGKSVALDVRAELARVLLAAAAEQPELAAMLRHRLGHLVDEDASSSTVTLGTASSWMCMLASDCFRAQLPGRQFVKQPASTPVLELMGRALGTIQAHAIHRREELLRELRRSSYGLGHERQTPLKVLHVTAKSPPSASELELDVEARMIRECIERSLYRDKLALVPLSAASFLDLSRALQNGAYELVHVSCHGADRELCLVGPDGRLELLGPELLRDRFADYAKPPGLLECVVLSACDSEEAGAEIGKVVPISIAMSGPAGNEAAREFTRGFYDAVGAGWSFGRAYREARFYVRACGLEGELAARKFPES